VKPLRFGIIGVGNIAPVHAAAINSVPEATLVAVTDRECERGHNFASEHNCLCYDDYRDLLASPDIDVVTVCTPHYLHAPMVKEIAAAGKHVMCEKPMAISVAECDEMIDACEKAGVELGIVFQSRFEELTLKLKAGLEAGKLGRLLWTGASCIWYRSAEYYRSAPWRGTIAMEGGGVLINQAVHTLDTLLWLGGAPAKVTARTRTLNHEIEVEDEAIAILEYADGKLGLVEATTNAYPGFPEKLSFFGTKGSAVFHKGEGRLEWHFSDPKEDVIDQGKISSGAARPMDINAGPHSAQFQEFAASLRAGQHPRVDGHEGRRSIALIEAIYRSAKSGQTIDVSQG
jgi:UDP-N-acetyl-2-amino-2-deoxyglucuronate dehydrogenase